MTVRRDIITQGMAAALIGAGLGSARTAMAGEVIRGFSPSRLDPIVPPPYVPPVNLAAIRDLYRRMTAPIRVNGKGPFAFVVDTGSNQTVISQELATRLGLPMGPQAELNGVAGVRMAPTTEARLDVGPRRRSEATMSILPAAAIGGDGLLGLDDLNGQAVTLDFRGKSLKIVTGAHLSEDPDAVVMKANRRNGQMTLVDADLSGLRLTAFLDSGAQNTIGNTALLALAVARDPTTTWSQIPIISATGQTIEARMANLPHLRVGGLHMPSWPVAFADLHTFRMWDLIDQPAILLGVDVLSRFESVCLNFSRDEVLFRLPASA